MGLYLEEFIDESFWLFLKIQYNLFKWGACVSPLAAQSSEKVQNLTH